MFKNFRALNQEIRKVITMKIDYLKKFYKKSQKEKVQSLKDAGFLSMNDYHLLNNNRVFLPIETANEMIENYLTNYELPFGLAMNFIIDGKEMILPMVTEEPSVIAAASNAGKLTRALGGFQTTMEERMVIGQIVLKNVAKSDFAKKKIKANETTILELANAAYPSILNYGGGAKKIESKTIKKDPIYDNPEFFIIHLFVDTGEAMGANIVNTMTEAISDYIIELIGGDSLMNILSNYATESIAKAVCSIDPKDLKSDEMNGEEVRDRIIEASQLAKVDPYRAVTHNKGIMNGVDALVLASGNDWRAIEAAIHAYAARDGQYRALSHWSKDDKGHLKGEIELPIAIGSVGGTLSVHPTAQLAHRILNNPSVHELSRILTALGLAQNLAALKALVTEGIQKGHMALQARSLAMRVGAKGDMVEQLTNELQKAEHINTKTAEEILKQLLETEIKRK